MSVTLPVEPPDDSPTVPGLPAPAARALRDLERVQLSSWVRNGR